MRRQTVEISITRAIADAMLGALTARPAAALLPTLTVRLMKTPVAIGPTTVLADLSECDFAGYAPVIPVAPVGPINDPDGSRAVLFDADFVASGALAPGGQISYGYYLTDSAGPPTALYGGEVFATPVPFALPGDALALDVLFPEPLIRPTGDDA